MMSMLKKNAVVFIRFPNWIGDAVMSTGGLRMIRQTRPDLRITAIMKPWVADLFIHNPDIDDFIIYSHRRGLPRIADFTRLTSQVRTRRFDGAILFQTAFESALMPFLAGIPIRVGLPTDHRRVLLTHPVSLDAAVKKQHQVTWYQEIARQILGKEVPSRPPGIEIPQEFILQAQKRLSPYVQGKTYLVTIAAGAAYGPAKQWLPERFAKFADRIATEKNACVVFCGGTSDAAPIQNILQASERKHVSLAGDAPLLVQAAAIRLSHLCLSNDSGLMHLAAALGTRVIALFGPTNPDATGPFGAGHRVLKKDVACAPCKHRRCPYSHECMKEITVSDVLETAFEILEEIPDKSCYSEAHDTAFSYEYNKLGR